MVFFAAIGLIIIGAGLPMAAMYACGQFVGQKAPHPLIKTAVMLIVGLGLLAAVGVAGLAMRRDGMDTSEWLMLAWMAGSALTGQIALSDRLDSRTNRAAT